MNHTRFICFIGSVCLVALLSGCFIAKQGKMLSTKKKGVLPDMQVSGSVLSVALDATIDTLDQQKAVYSSSFELIGNLIDGLMQMADDGSMVNAICAEETLSEDGRIYTFKLRDDAYWSNGDPVTAHDFVYGWQRAVDPQTESEYAFMMSDIAQIKNAVAIQAGKMDPDQLGVRALDDYTFQVELHVPVSYFNQLLCFCTFYPANRAFVEKCGDAYGTSPETYLSNGAFILTKYEPNAKSISLIKNTAYYDASIVKLGGIEYSIITDPAETLRMYQSGKLDLIKLNGSQVPSQRNSPEFITVDSGFLYYISTNLHVADLQNTNLRLALTMAINRDAIGEALGNGSKSAYQCVPSGFAFDSAGQDFNRGNEEFAYVCAYNPEKAREYLALAQQELNKKQFTLELLVGDPAEQVKAANVIKESIEESLPDVTISLRIIPKSSRRKTMAAGDYELGVTNWGPDYADPMTYLSMWMTGNDNNTGDYSNPIYDAIIADCQDGALCTKPAERWKALKQAETVIMENAIVFPIYQQCNADLIKSNVKNIAFHPVAINRIYKKTTK
ncbi:MAG: peptide ABC transporter substrate-binding protein [Treponema sp.]|nr:peptide ABC transporter substrate-binding protein [Treponema sp.]